MCARVCVCVLFLTSILVPNREHPEYKGAERGGKIPPPVIPHRKVGRRDLNTEQYPWWWRGREGAREGAREDYREEEALDAYEKWEKRGREGGEG